MNDMELHEGDFVFVRSVTATYGPHSRLQYKAPKGKLLVLVAVEVADGTETAGVVRDRVRGKINSWPSRNGEGFEPIGAEIGSVVTQMRI